MKANVLQSVFFIFILGSTLFFSSCKEDDKIEPDIPNEEEVITTLKYTLVNNADVNDTAIFILKDLDGDGGASIAGELFIIDSLKAGATYNGSIEFLNETNPNAIDTITAEVEDEGTEHEIFYDLLNMNNSTVTKTDTDSNGNPLGLKTTLVVQSSPIVNLGIINIVLKHEPKKPNNNTVTDAGGETDKSVVFTSIKTYL
ncbi:MAG: hypothetical protein AB8B61_06780 [Cyclobacteriaceae bacterium]